MNILDMILDEANIFKAVYSLPSYLHEPNLLSVKDYELWNKLKDVFDLKLIEKTIKQCQSRIKDALINNRYFETTIYLRIKSYDKKAEFRPLHTASLIDQICLMAILNVLVYDYNDKCVTLSSLTKSLPSNFYGNNISLKPNLFYKKWQKSYTLYTERVLEEYQKSLSTGLYNAEINLDIEKFFPSIDPILIKNEIKKNLTFKFEKDELLDNVLEKLLILKVTNKVDENNKCYINNGFTVGLPQGLPQSPYFANHFMKKVKAIVEKTIDGKAFYYVDDSVIFSTIENDDDFKNKIEKINEDLKQYSSSNNSYYRVKMHEAGKSYYAEINKENFNLIKIKTLTNWVSSCSGELNKTMNQNQDRIINSKFNAIFIALQEEIKRVKSLVQDKNEDESLSEKLYLKRLLRYKKFYEYRNLITSSRIENIDIKKYVEDIIIKYFLNNGTDIKNFVEQYDESIFMAEINFLLQSNNDNDILEFDRLFKIVKNFELKILKLTNYGYFTKCMEIMKLKKFNINKYDNLSALVMPNKNVYLRNSEKFKWDEIYKLLKEENPNDYCYNKILKDFTKYHKLICKYDKEIVRKVLNVSISKILNISVGDDITVVDVFGRTLSFYEFRLIMFLRNANFDIDKLSIFSDRLLKEINTRFKDKSDYEVVNACSLFIKFIADPIKIDNLLILYKHVSDLWENGSKYLHFYTLHNQQHSIALIELSIEIIKAIDYFSLKQIDYYYLFISCLLHDIAMVEYPDLSIFLRDKSQANLIAAQFMKDSKCRVGDLNASKIVLLKYFKEMDNFYENLLRQNHGEKSAEIILNMNEYEFLEETARTLIAEICKSHVEDAENIYYKKSEANNQLYSKKYIEIILRLADLLDITKTRVNWKLLQENFDSMNKTSVYHWVSHGVIESCSINAHYEFNANALYVDNIDSSLIDKNYLKETIEIIINLGYFPINCENYNHKCKNCNVEFNIADKNFVIKPSINDCNKSECPMICKWMANKNNYLHNEIYFLQQYLSNLEFNLFDTEICIKYAFTNEIPMESEFLDVVVSEIDK